VPVVTGRRVWALALGAIVTVTAAPSAAQEPPVPVVGIASVGPVILAYSCGAIDADVTMGEVVLARTGELVAGLDVTAEIATDGNVQPSSARFSPGDENASILVLSFRQATIVVTLVDEDGYDLGEPATATVPVDDSAVERGCPPHRPPDPPDPPDPPEPPVPTVVEPAFAG
jgi:hypothetical protein